MNELIIWIDSFKEEASTRRFEENINFIFKLAFKKLKNYLLKKNRISFYNKKFDGQFYEHYFRETADRLKIDIKAFHDPLNNKGKLKTLTSEYFKLLFNSSAFQTDFVNYITCETIKVDYQTTLRRKIRHLLLKFDNLFGTEDQTAIRTGVEKAQTYFRKNRQCKLPWTNTEILTAVNTFIHMIKSL